MRDHREITSAEDAVAHRMAGSPTLLVDGVDPFGVGTPYEYTMACRISWDERGRAVPIPSTVQLRAAITGDPGNR
jgi:hypothetical protein